MDLTNLKLVIWDLDDSFWDGTLSEGPVRLEELFHRYALRTTNLRLGKSLMMPVSRIISFSLLLTGLPKGSV